MKHSNRRLRWWFLPFLLALPVIAGIAFAWIRYGQTVSNTILAGIKLAVLP